MNHPLLPRVRRWMQQPQAASARKAQPSLSEQLPFTAVHGIRSYNEPQLTVGSRSPQTFIAPAVEAVGKRPAPCPTFRFSCSLCPPSSTCANYCPQIATGQRPLCNPLAA
jgi:hypothetical protein